VLGVGPSSDDGPIFNLANASTVVSLNNSVGGTYLEPREIISPRIIRVGFSIDF
jgi:hypothetical protein